MTLIEEFGLGELSDDNAVHDRDDVVVLTGKELRAPMHIVGRYTVYPGNGEDVWESSVRTRARQTLSFGGRHGGVLTLPLVDGARA